jgi:hypothetical protein
MNQRPKPVEPGSSSVEEEDVVSARSAEELLYDIMAKRAEVESDEADLHHGDSTASTGVPVSDPNSIILATYVMEDDTPEHDAPPLPPDPPLDSRVFATARVVVDTRRPVDDQAPNSNPTSQDTTADHDTASPTTIVGQPNNPRIWCIVTLVSCVLGLLAVVGGVCGLGDSCRKQPPDVSNSTTPPVRAPSIGNPNVENASRNAQVAEYINSVTLSNKTIGSVANGTTTNVDTSRPEALALSWLMQQDPLEWLVPTILDHQFRLRQRYALQTMLSQQRKTGLSHALLINASAHECQWPGITCQYMEVLFNGTSVEQWVVTGIDWSQTSLQGRLSSDLGLLSHLSRIKFYGNVVSGSIPNALGFWTNMVEFNVAFNDLTGSLPATIDLWTILASCSIDSNKLTGTIPSALGNAWSHLEILGMSDNMLSGTIPSSFGNLTSLQKVYFHFNSFDGAIPSGMCTLRDLRLTSLQADCSTQVTCECCTRCF